MSSDICKIINDADLSVYSSMKTGGKAKTLYLPESADELKRIIKHFKNNDTRYLILGNLSNVLIPDEGIDVPVVITAGVKAISVVSETDDEALVSAECGASFTKLSMDMCRRGFSGLEFAYGIPGSVGGAAFMNAGAYSGEFSCSVEYICVLDRNAKEVIREKSDCGFGYRKSVFSDSGDCVLSAAFRLQKKEPEVCINQAKEYMSRRIEKQPLEYPSCGSAFKRPKDSFAGKLIEDAGLKGYSIGGACISEKHAGFVINKGKATTADVINLMTSVREKVFKDSGIMLEPEICILNKNGEKIHI